MKIPRISIGRMMVVVSVIALNAGLVRGLIVSGQDEVLIGIALTAIVVQAGVLQAIRGKRRAFWAGFVVAGLLIMSTWFLGTPGSARRLPNGRLIVTPASVTYRFWGSYTEGAFAVLARLNFEPLLALRRPNQSRVDEALVYTTFAVLFAMPQILGGAIGGLLGLGVGRRGFEGRNPNTPGEATASRDPNRPEDGLGSIVEGNSILISP